LPVGPHALQTAKDFAPHECPDGGERQRHIRSWEDLSGAIRRRLLAPLQAVGKPALAHSIDVRLNYSGNRKFRSTSGTFG
jgi:hypothetical protein